jgi:hypothetical protein
MLGCAIQRCADAPGQFAWLRLQDSRCRRQAFFHFINVRQRRITRHGFHAPDAGADGALSDDLEQPDIASAPHMRAAAKFQRIDAMLVGRRRVMAHADHAHFFAVFFTK